jgi:hypothetical protein
LLSTGLRESGVLVIDTTTLAVVRSLISDDRPDTAVFAPDDTTVAVAGNTVQFFNGRTGGAPSKSLAIPASTGRLFRIVFNGANELWLVRRNAIIKFDLTETDPPLVISNNARAINAFDGKLYVADESTLRVLASDGTQETSFPLVDQRGHTLARTRF